MEIRYVVECSTEFFFVLYQKNDDDFDVDHVENGFNWEYKFTAKEGDLLYVSVNSPETTKIDIIMYANGKVAGGSRCNSEASAIEMNCHRAILVPTLEEIALLD